MLCAHLIQGVCKCVVFLGSAARGYCSAALDSAGQLLVFWVQSGEADLIHLRFSFGVLSTFTKNIEGFYFKLVKDYEMADSVHKNKQPYSWLLLSLQGL